MSIADATVGSICYTLLSAYDAWHPAYDVAYC